MFAIPVIMLLVAGLDEPAASATTQAAATSRPAIDIEFRPVHVFDRREKDISKLFPPKKVKSPIDGGDGRAAVTVNADCRRGLSIRFKLTADLEDSELVLRKLQITELVPDEGVWPNPLAGVWLNNTELDDEDMEEHLRFFRHHNMREKEGAYEFNVDVGLNRPPAQVRMIMLMNGTLEFNVVEHTIAAIDIDKAQTGKFEPNAILNDVGIKVRLAKPGNQPKTNRTVSAEFKGTIKNLVDAYIAEPPAKDGELAGPKIQADESTSGASSSLFGSGGNRKTEWESERKLPAGARLVVRVVSGRRTETAPFSFEEIPLPR